MAVCIVRAVLEFSGLVGLVPVVVMPDFWFEVMSSTQSEEIKALKREILCLKQQLKLERFIAGEYKKQIEAARALLTATLPASKTDAVLAEMKGALDS